MRNTIIAIAALLTAGCASTQAVLNQPPKQVFTTDNPYEDVVFCLANKNHAPALPQRDGSTVILIKNGYGGTAMTFTVYPDGEGSRIEWREAFETIGAAWKRCVGLKADA